MAGLFSFALLFVPLANISGYEHTLLGGLVLPSLVAIFSALRTSHSEAPFLFHDAKRNLALAGLISMMGISCQLVAMLVTAPCDWRDSLLHYGLAVGFGTLLGSLWGTYVGTRVAGSMRRRLLAIVLGLSMPLLSALIGIYRFYSSPMVFNFDPFVGFFSGTLYDTVIDAVPRLLTYRAGSVGLLIFGLTILTSIVRERREQRVSFRFRGMTYAKMGTASLGLFLWGAITINGPKLGHWSTVASIRSELGRVETTDRFELVVPDSLARDEIELMKRDCREQLRAVETKLGFAGPERITIYYFKDADQKRRMMGAAHTLIAKPWRREVYINVDSYPHPVLGHELAHVVAGSAARGPWKVAGRWNGWIPNPGLIEGIAVFASPDDDEYSPVEWSRAMLDLGLLPKLDSVLGFGFFTSVAARSYTVAGAFFEFLASSYRTESVARIFRGESMEAVTGHSVRAIDDEFRTFLRKREISTELSALAKSRFDRPPVFGRTCPHAVDQALARGEACRREKQFVRAQEYAREAFRYDPRHPGVELMSLVSELYTARAQNTERDWLAAMDTYARRETTPRAQRIRAREWIADLQWLQGDRAGAYDTVTALLQEPLEEDLSRTLEVKQELLSSAQDSPTFMNYLLRDRMEAFVSRFDHAPDAALAFAHVLVEARTFGTPMAAYLAGKSLVQKREYAAAKWLLRDALSATPPLPKRVVRETIRLGVITACVLKDEPFMVSLQKREEYGVRAARIATRCER